MPFVRAVDDDLALGLQHDWMCSCPGWTDEQAGDFFDRYLRMRQLLRLILWVPSMLFVRGMTMGVRVIATNAQEEVLLVRHGYTPGWHLPGGGVDRGETMEDAARRELEEETGYRVEGIMTLRGMSYNRQLWKGDHVGVFVAQAIAKQFEIKPGFEIAEMDFFSLNDLPEGTTKGTRARLAEWQDGRDVEDYWS